MYDILDLLANVLEIAEGNNPNPSGLSDEDKATLAEAHYVIDKWLATLNEDD